MARLFLSDALDSKIICAADYHDSKSREAYLRLRLHALMLILFGRKLLVSEGWALDSMTFIRVASEIADAAEDLRKDGYKTKELFAFSPIVMEKRRSGGFQEIFSAYADREDVRWSGFMPYSKDIEIRNYIRANLGNAANITTRMPDQIYRTFSEIVPDSSLPQDMASVARYFTSATSREAPRIIATDPSPTAFQHIFNSLLGKMATPADFGCNFPVHLDGSARKMLNTAAQSAIDQGMSFQTSSLAMQFADHHDDPNVRDALMIAINIAYMKVSSNAANAHMSTPAHSAGSADEHIDRIITTSLDTHEHGYDLFFINGHDATHDITKKLAAVQDEDWRQIWKKAIELSYNPHWRKSLVKFSADLSRGGYSRAINSASYAEIEENINKSIPEICLNYSLSYRFFGYKGSERARKYFQGVAGASVGAFFGAIVAIALPLHKATGIILGTISGAGIIAANKFLEASIKESLTEKVNPFSETGFGAKRSSILDWKMRHRK